MADQTAFNADGTITTTPQEPSEETPAQEPTNPSFRDLLVGDGKKFSDDEALAKGKYESDQFVEQLQSENKGLREELDRRITTEDTVDKLLQERQSTQQQEGVTTPSPQMSEQDIAELVKQTIETTRTAEAEQNNISQADKAMEDRFGDKRAEWLAGKATELGVGIAFLQSIAAASPKLFLTTVGLEGQTPKGQGGVSQGSTNTEALNANPVSPGTTPGTFKWYEEQRKANPRGFWAPETQQQLMKDRTEKGEEAFYA
jgi:hypothetical protein|tara:strand:- start:4026 stop:4799 length:774 start_codon:yes stop_codon:yes gene_type:complete